VAWRDLRRIHPQDFTITNVPKLLERKGDAWRTLMPPRQSLARLARELENELQR
jgi:DNA primase